MPLLLYTHLGHYHDHRPSSPARARTHRQGRDGSTSLPRRPRQRQTGDGLRPSGPIKDPFSCICGAAFPRGCWLEMRWMHSDRLSPTLQPSELADKRVCQNRQTIVRVHMHNDAGASAEKWMRRREAAKNLHYITRFVRLRRRWLLAKGHRDAQPTKADRLLFGIFVKFANENIIPKCRFMSTAKREEEKPRANKFRAALCVVEAWMVHEERARIRAMEKPHSAEYPPRYVQQTPCGVFYREFCPPRPMADYRWRWWMGTALPVCAECNNVKGKCTPECHANRNFRMLRKVRLVRIRLCRDSEGPIEERRDPYTCSTCGLKMRKCGAQ